MSTATPATTAIPVTQFIPKWQEISGLTPAAERSMSDKERDDALRALMREVTRLSREEFQREVPEGERSFLWEPIERVCHKLGIARLRLTRFCRELTGMRAYEITDKIKAEPMGVRIIEWVRQIIKNLDKEMRAGATEFTVRDEPVRVMWANRIVKELRKFRIERPQKWAALLAFPTIPRLRRGCMLAHHCTVEELELDMVRQLVQKFFDDLAEELGFKSPWNRDTAGDKDLIPGTLFPVYYWKRYFDRLPEDLAAAKAMFDEYKSKHAGITVYNLKPK
jgi:hypothetical protein